MSAVPSSCQTFSGALEAAVDDFVEAAKQVPKQRSKAIDVRIEFLVTYAQKHGLPSNFISKILAAVIHSNQLDQSSVRSLVDGLSPSAKVSSDIIYRIVHSLGHGPNPSIGTQNLLLRWIFRVRKLLDEYAVLDKLYSVLFSLIDSFGIRVSLCHLLAIITRRQHVKPFRIRKLCKIVRTVGSEPALLGLLFAFKKVQPHVKFDDFQAISTASEHLDQDWERQLRTMHTFERETSLQKWFIHPKLGLFQENQTRAFIPPNFLVSQARWLLSPIYEPSHLDHFVTETSEMESSDQIISIIDDIMMQHNRRVRKCKHPHNRLDHWLAHFFSSQWNLEQSGGLLTEKVVTVLTHLAMYIEHTGHMPFVVEDFLKAYIKHWDGLSNQTLIINLMVQLPVQPFNELQTKVLNTFERTLLLSGTLTGGVTLLAYYARLVLHWSAMILGSSTKDHQNLTDHRSSMVSLIDYSGLLALNLLSVHFPPSQTVVHDILVHLSMISQRSQRLQPPPPPSPLIIYLLIFTSSHPQSLSAVCTVLTAHRHNFEDTGIDATLPVPPHDRDQVNALNGVLMDTANLIWRSRAFNASDSNAQACLLPRNIFSKLQAYASSIPMPSQNVVAVFGFSSHPLLSGIAIAAFRQVEDTAINGGTEIRVRHAGPITQRSLGALEKAGGVKGIGWKEYRIGVLDWLSERGLPGVQGLMRSTMKGMRLG